MERFSDFRSLLVTLAFLLTFWDRSRFVSGSDEEGLLMHQLLGHAYNNLVRPRGEGVNGTLKVKIGMRLSQLLDMVSRCKVQIEIRLFLSLIYLRVKSKFLLKQTKETRLV